MLNKCETFPKETTSGQLLQLLLLPLKPQNVQNWLLRNTCYSLLPARNQQSRQGSIKSFNSINKSFNRLNSVFLLKSVFFSHTDLVQGRVGCQRHALEYFSEITHKNSHSHSHLQTCKSHCFTSAAFLWTM